MNVNLRCKRLAAGLVALASLVLAAGQPTSAATEEEIIAAVDAGVAWLVESQQGDGSWLDPRGSYGTTGLACLKLMDYATDPDRGLGLPSPFDESYIYRENVENCVNWILNRANSVAIGPQPAGNPDTNGNNIGVRTQRFWTYESAIALMAMCNTVELGRVATTGPQTGRTYLDIAEDMAEYIYFIQNENAQWRGGWRYSGNDVTSDNSVAGWVGFGLGFAEAAAPEGCGFDVPQFVKDEMALWVDYIQSDVSGCSGYSNPGSWENVLKQGHLLQQLAFLGHDSSSPAVTDALSCLCTRYDHPSQDPGWTGGFGTASYQATYALTKGLLSFGDDLKFICDPEKDWCFDFDDEIVNEQNADGSWPADCRWSNRPELCTAWALLTLERAVPPPPGEFTKELTSGPDYDSDGEIDLVVEVNTLTPETYDFTITYTLPGDTPVLIEDTVPAEWNVELMDDTLGCMAAQANKGGKADKSATKISCAEPNDGSVVVYATTRCHDNRNNQFCRPTSCGALWLNDGALAYEVDEFGEPLVDEFGERLPPVETTEGICLAAVYDVGSDGIDWTGGGDEDGDSLSDYDEACSIGTDPCLADSDGDGVFDDTDECPLEGDMGYGVDAVGCPNPPPLVIE